jgi:aldose 1-epimerase
MSFSVTVNKNQTHPTIVLKAGTSEAEIHCYGGFLNSFTIHKGEQSINIIDGFGSVDDAIENMTPAFKSALLSPFTCRMNQGDYIFDGKSYHVNKFYLPPHAIHGLLYDAVHTITATSSDENYVSVTLEYNYNKEDNGYPFSFTLEHVWKLEEGNKLSVTSTIVHNNTHAIPYAQGWHPYFNLGTSVDECTLQFDSNIQLEFDETLLPTGKKLEDSRFSKDNSLENIFLDNCFVLNNGGKCVLKNKNVELTIQPESDYPYLQIYTPPHRNSIAIENLSGAPDCFNNNVGLLLIQPNTKKSFTTSYQVSFVS